MSVSQSVSQSVPIEGGEVKPFYFQQTAWMLTYKHHIGKEDYMKWIQELIPTRKFKFLRMAHENGKDDPDTPYEHTHVVIRLDKRFITQNARFFDYEHDFEMIHPHILPIDCRGKHFENACSYLGKEDPENEDLIKKRSLAEIVWSNDTLGDALIHLVRKPNDASGIKLLYENKPLDYSSWFEEFADWKPWIWQEYALERAQMVCDKRTINWFYERIGNVGKSNFCDSREFCPDSNPKDYYLLAGLTNSYHLATIIEGAIAEGWNGKCLMIDLPRTTERNDGFYTCLEDLVNGRVTVQKFKGKTIRIPQRPNIIVFANWLPRFYRRDKEGKDLLDENGDPVPYMSIDRWKIYHIGPEECKHRIPDTDSTPTGSEN